MNLPHRVPQPERDELDNLLGSMSKQLGAITEAATSVAERRPDDAAAPAVPPPGRLPEGRGRGSMWGPSHPHIIGPMQVLLQVVERAHQLRTMTEELLTGLTGEKVEPNRLKAVPLQREGLLPTILCLAEEVDRVHAEIGRLVAHMRGQL
jgi:hypothetical protein